MKPFDTPLKPHDSAHRPHCEVALPQWTVHVDLTLLRVRRSGTESAGHMGDREDAFVPMTVHRADPTLRTASRRAPSPICVIATGFLTDCGELARQLDTKKHDIAHIAMIAYLRWGLELFEHIDGGFMIAIWDGAEGEFILGRDAVGKHPAYYAIQGDALRLSSNVLELSRSPGLTTEADRLSIARRLLFRPPEVGRTFFSAIRRLPPAHFLHIRAGRAGAIRRYWQLLPQFDEPWLPEGQVLTEYEAILARATDRCLDMGAGGVLLSGGTDSSCVAALAVVQARARGLPVPLACCGKSPPGFPIGRDERMQDRVSELLGMPRFTGHDLYWLDGADLLGASLSYTPMLPGPTTLYWMGAFMGFYRSIHGHGVHTVMSGSGGDEWMGVHESHFTDLVCRMDVAQAWLFITALATGRGAGRAQTARNLIWRWAIRHPGGVYLSEVVPQLWARRRRVKLRQAMPAWLRSDTELADSLVADTFGHSPVNRSIACRGDRWYRQAIARLYHNPFMNYELERRYHLGHALGLRLLSPFQDRQVVHFFNRISPSTLIQAGVSKALLRRIIDKHIGAPDVTAHPKMYDTHNSFLQDELRAHLAKYTRNSDFAAVRELGLIDVGVLKRSINDLDRAPVTALAQIFGILSTEWWLRCNF